MSLDVECQALGPPHTREEPVDCTARRNSINGVEAGRRRPRDVQIIIKAECEVVCRNARLQCCKDENLFRGADLEDTAAAVSYIKVTVMIERDPRGDAHAFDEQFGMSG